MCAPSAPPAPDYAAAATAQGAANVDAARATLRGSNPNIISPQGTRTVSWDGDTPTMRIQYSPEQQAIYDINQQGQRGLATIGRDAVNRVGGILGQNVDFNRDLGTMAQGRQNVIDSMMSRYDTDMAKRQGNLESNLIARGIPKGSEAWNREMDVLQRGRNDALQQATLAADAKSMDERRQAITELLAQRQTPLNEISALRTGSQVAPLSFQPYTGTTYQPAPVFQAAAAQGQAGLDAYNAQAASNDAMMTGLFRLGASSMGGTNPWFLS